MPISDPLRDLPEADRRWIPVARLLRPQGRKGELLAEPLSDLDGLFIAGREFRMTAASHSTPVDQPPPATGTALLENMWRPVGRNAGRLVLKLAGVDSISAAEALEAVELSLPETSLPDLDEDTYLVRDLVGCTLVDGEASLGTVCDLQFPIASDGHTRLPDAADLLVVQPFGAAPDADPVLVPFVKAWLVSVDTDARRIVMHLPPGLGNLALPEQPASAPEDIEAGDPSASI